MPFFCVSVKFKTRNFCVPVKFKGNTLGIPMDQEDSDRYRRLDPDDSPGFFMQLAIDHLTNVNAQDIYTIMHFD